MRQQEEEGGVQSWDSFDCFELTERRKKGAGTEKRSKKKWERK
jgi:hypothetical protein